MNPICHQKQFKLSRLFTLCFAASVAIGAVAPASAASLGHSRLVSGVGQALRIHIPIKQITDSELASLNVSPAPQQQWQESGLTPPVELSSISVGLIDGPSAGSHVLVVSSQQVFNKQIADLLLDVKTDSGSQAYQVSILAQNDANVIQAPSAATPVSLSQGVSTGGASVESTSSGSSASATSNQSTATGSNIVVQSGDTMFAIAQRNTVANASVYQVMIALQSANPNAFINDNINLVKAGATLTMPDNNAINALSDTQARKIFNQQVLSFKQGFNLGDNENIIGSSAETNQSSSAKISIDEESAPQDQTDNQADSDKQDNDLSINAQKIDAENIDAQPSDKNDAEKQLESQSQSQDDEKSSDSSKSNTDKSADRNGESTNNDSVDNKSSDELKLSNMLNGAAQGIANSMSSAALAAENSDAFEDAKVAGDKAVEYTQEKISQLEENVKNLNKALTAQGSAASEAIIEGALELQKALTDEEDESSALNDANKGSDDSANSSKNDGLTSDDNSETSGSSNSSANSTGASDNDTGDTDNKASSQSGEPTTTEANTDNTKNDSAGLSSSDSGQNLITPTEKPKAWFKKYFLALAGGLIGLIILIIVWVLRRSYVAENVTTAVTPEMVQEKLNQIDLNLDEPSIKDDK